MDVGAILKLVTSWPLVPFSMRYSQHFAGNLTTEAAQLSPPSCSQQ